MCIIEQVFGNIGIVFGQKTGFNKDNRIKQDPFKNKKTAVNPAKPKAARKTSSCGCEEDNASTIKEA